MTSPQFSFHYRTNLEEPWLDVRDGGLEQPIRIRFQVVGGVSVRIVGIEIQNDQPITSATLRSIPVGRLSEEVMNFLREELDDLAYSSHHIRQWFEVSAHMDPDAVVRRTTVMHEYLDPEEHAASELDEVEMLEMAIRSWLESDDGANGSTAFAPRTRGAKAPTEAEYRKFALIYLSELKTKAKGAKGRAAERAGMDRGTAYRWIAKCEEMGLLTTRTEGTR